MSERRRYLRVPANEPGLIEFAPPTLGSMTKMHATMMVSTVSCEGLSLSTAQPLGTLCNGARLDVHMLVQHEEIMLPGTIAWMSKDPSGMTNIGVALSLSLATARVRQTWAEWVVNATERHTAQLRARGSGSHKIQQVSRAALRRAKTEEPK